MAALHMVSLRMSVLGVDPGTGGALATYHPNGMLDVIDIPHWYAMVGKKKRRRIDAVELMNFMEMAKLGGVELVVIEEVGQRPRQSGMFVFGFSAGLIYMACVAVKIPIETVKPQIWKRLMNVPGKKGMKKEGDYEAAIIHRADEMMPSYAHMWRGPQGGRRVDRAEAAMLAKYGNDHALRSTEQVRMGDTAWYRHTSTGE